MMLRQKARAAFTLVELSIVLVILGLLVGGVLSGQALIHAAELRAVTTEYDQYSTAINTFKDKYFALPGDMPNAYQFWNTACGAGNKVTDSSSVGCNGDGDGKISWLEGPQMWKHLQLAGLTNTNVTVDCRTAGYTASPLYYGFYHGAPQITSCANYPGVTIPQSKVANMGWTVFYSNYSKAHIAQLSGDSSNNPVTNATIGGKNWRTLGNGWGLKPEDVWSIDVKMDDGVPNKGSVIAGGWRHGGCYVESGGAPGTYTLTTTTQLCPVIIKLGI